MHEFGYAQVPTSINFVPISAYKVPVFSAIETRQIYGCGIRCLKCF
jgi:hypothetical protein